MKKVLLLGGTGAMGVYLTPELLKMGYAVDVVSLDKMESDNPNLRYRALNAMDNTVLAELLKNDYHAIVDFLIYPNVNDTLAKRLDLLLSSTGHYIYLSSYRIYAGKDKITTESSPRLLDVSEDPVFLAAKDREYSLYKAMGEDLLKAHERTNWTAIRPAITYSKRRFQLVTLEANVVVKRMKAGKAVILPEQAMEVQGTMSWAGDVAKMIARLIGNKNAYGEIYSVCTAEHHPWREIAEYYRELGGLKYITVDKEDYIRLIGVGDDHTMRVGWQLEYDRLFDRVMDNSKILNITGLKQSELMPLKEGLRREFSNLPADYVWTGDEYISDRMDGYLLALKKN